MKRQLVTESGLYQILSHLHFTLVRVTCLIVKKLSRSTSGPKFFAL